VGRRIAIDVGTKRIGVAVSDSHGILASPLTTLDAALDIPEIHSTLKGQIEGNILEIYVGLPIALSGNETNSTQNAKNFALALKKVTDVPVLLIDERLTTSLANQQLKSVGKSQKEARSTIDQMAAVAILEYALAVEGNQGGIPGIRVEDYRD